jgi:hypothetical protein
MPAIQRGQPYRLGPNRWGLRYYDAEGKRHRKSPFPSKSAAVAHYRDVIEPELRGEAAPLPELTLAELVEVYLERHASTVRPGQSPRCESGYATPPARTETCLCGTWSACRGRSPDGEAVSPKVSATPVWRR